MKYKYIAKDGEVIHRKYKVDTIIIHKQKKVGPLQKGDFHKVYKRWLHQD